MKSNDMQAALQAFLQSNPDLPEGEAVVDEPQPKDGKKPKLNVRLETKGRKGKPATIISGLSAIDDEDAGQLASDLKKRLATGGSYRGDEILIQGDRRADVIAALRAMGFKTNNL